MQSDLSRINKGALKCLIILLDIPTLRCSWP